MAHPSICTGGEGNSAIYPPNESCVGLGDRRGNRLVATRAYVFRMLGLRSSPDAQGAPPEKFPGADWRGAAKTRAPAATKTRVPPRRAAGFPRILQACNTS